MARSLVFRVETPTGLGPWCNEEGNWNEGAGTDWCSNAMSLHYHAQAWLKKKKENKNNNWRFGFLSFHQLFNYMNGSATTIEEFNRNLNKMVELNLIIGVYSAGYGDVIGDETQCIFDKKEAKAITMLHPKSEFVRKELENYLSFSERMLESGNEILTP